MCLIYSYPQASADITSQRTGGSTCSATWYWDYWGYYWRGWWRRPTVIVTGPADIGYAGCSQWRAVLAFSFMAMFAYLVSAILVSLWGWDGFHGSTALG
jgi:hypothetical protein